MSLIIDSSDWVSGCLLIGETGFGVLAENIPSTGGDGASYLYNDLSLPADNGKEICGQITSWPSAGSLYAYEDGSFTFTGAPDGAYSFEYQLYVDGEATGSPVTVDLLVGVLTLQPGLFTSTSAFFAPTVTPGEVTLAPSLLTNTSVFFAPTVTPGEVTLTPSLFSNANTFFSPVVNLDGALTLAPDRFDNTSTFYAPTVTPGDVALAPSFFTNSNQFFAAVVSITGTAVYPLPAQVLLGVTYGPNGNDYTGTATGGAGPTAAEIAAEVLAVLGATNLPVNVVRMNGALVNGDGTAGNLWRGA